MTTNDSVTTIYLIRHGETDWNAQGRCQGTTDIPLNAAGYAQADAIARALASVTFDAAYTSPLSRTRDTANAILASRNLEIIEVPEFIELSYGDLAGTRRDMWDQPLRHAWENDPWSVTFPNGESLHMVRSRAIPAFERIVESHRGQTVLVSSHGHLNRVLTIHTRELPLDDFWKIEQENASVTIFHLPLFSTGT